jgi:hypothetical protein
VNKRSEENVIIASDLLGNREPKLALQVDQEAKDLNEEILSPQNRKMERRKRTGCSMLSLRVQREMQVVKHLIEYFRRGQSRLV